MKLAFARLNQEISGLEVELLGEEGLLYDDWTMRRPELVDFTGRDAGYRYLRSKGNCIEGGTSEVLLNIVAERVLGLPVRAAHRQGRRLEGPAPDDAPQPDLLYSEDEDALRAAVRALLADRCDAAGRDRADRVGRAVRPRLWKALADGHGPRRAAGAREARRPGRQPPRSRRGAGGVGPRASPPCRT